MSRQGAGKFCAYDVGLPMSIKEDGQAWLVRTIKWHTVNGIKGLPETRDEKVLDVFTPAISPEKLHPSFVRLVNFPTYVPARSVITEMMPHYVDIDGNFVEQFQSTGFDARLWELYLYAYLVEEGISIERKFPSPDFIVEDLTGHRVAIEATTVGRKLDNPLSYFDVSPKRYTSRQIQEANKDSMPIKFGSPLYSKLNKRYWEMPQVRGNPLVFAIADFHDDVSMLWSSTALINYLYGVNYDFYYDNNNQLIITPLDIDTHRAGNKEIPSGFFFQPNSEYVSAVIFSASGTISKFNRIGRQAGFRHPKVMMIRVGTCHDHDPNASMPKRFMYEVNENCNETWAEGLSMYHNPNAIHPVPDAIFPSIAHHHFSKGLIVSCLPEFHPYASFTYNLIS